MAKVAVRNALLRAMTVATGAVDVVSYVGLGGVFTANMTGNLVLLGISGGAGRAISVDAGIDPRGSAGNCSGQKPLLETRADGNRWLARWGLKRLSSLT